MSAAQGAYPQPYQQGYQQQGYQAQPVYQQQLQQPYQQGGYQQGAPSYGYQQAYQAVPGSPQAQYYEASSGYTPQQQAQPQQNYVVVTGQPIYPDCDSELLKQKFVVQGYQDVWAAVVFILHIVATIIWAFVNIGKYSDDYKDDDHVDVDNQVAHKMEVWLPGACAASLGIALLMLCFIRIAPRQFILGANILVILLNIAGAIYCFTHVPGLGVMFLLFAALNALWLWLVRRRIPLAGALLANSIQVVTRHYGTIITSIMSILVLVVYVIFFGLMVIPTVQHIQNESNDNSGSGTMSKANGGTYFLVLLFLLFFYWSTQVIANVVHVTSAGTVATWYFAGVNNMPRNPSVASLKRAMTTSFGSICFGSLIVAILQVIRAIVRSAARQRDSFLTCIALCIISCIERLMEYFNVYAFTHVAIYGSSYVDAAKQTWEMIKNCGITAIINDNLVFPVLSLTALFDSVVLGVIFGLAAKSVVIGVIAGIISYVLHLLIFRVVYSAVVTIFVCYAENPEIASQTNPQFFAELQEGLQALSQPIC